MGDELVRLLAERQRPAAPIDAGRMQRARHARLQTEMDRQGVDVALLLHGPNVAYATGAPPRGVDVTHAVFQRPVAVLVAGQERPHLFADGAGGADDECDPDVEHHPPLWPELDEGATAMVAALAEVAGRAAAGRVAVDEMTGAMLRTGVVDPAAVADAGQLVAAAKVLKTDDELECIAVAQRCNEAAMVATQAAARSGVARSTLAGVFLAELAAAAGDHGAGANLIDPIFQPMPRRVLDGPRTTTGTAAFPIGAGNPTLSDGDLVWVDSGIDHRGYASDFGRTWVVGRDPTPDEQALFERWCDVMLAVLGRLGPGVTASELCREATAANGGARPWLPYFYLAHGVGVESAEMPLVGTDLGPDFDERLVLAPGMVLVLEPVIWEDGVGGYRSEEIVAVTEDGWCHLGGGHPYTPFLR